jgi:hypothetical protein
MAWWANAGETILKPRPKTVNPRIIRWVREKAGKATVDFD